MNVVKQYDDIVNLLKLPRSILARVLNVVQNVERIVVVKTSHDYFINDTVTQVFAKLDEGKVSNYWVQTITDAQVYESLATMTKIHEDKLIELFAKTLPVSIQVYFTLKSGNEPIKVNFQPVFDTWLACTFYALQSIASVSYGQLLSARLKSKLTALALLFSLFKLKKLNERTSLLQIDPIIHKVSLKYKLPDLKANVEKVFELFKEGIRDYSDSKLDKLLSSLFIELDIIVKPQVIIYYLSKFTLQRQWFFTLVEGYTPSWWYLDSGQALELKLHGLLSQQKKLLKQLIKQNAIVG